MDTNTNQKTNRKDLLLMRKSMTKNKPLPDVKCIITSDLVTLYTILVLTLHNNKRNIWQGYSQIIQHSIFLMSTKAYTCIIIKAEMNCRGIHPLRDSDTRLWPRISIISFVSKWWSRCFILLNLNILTCYY